MRGDTQHTYTREATRIIHFSTYMCIYTCTYICVYLLHLRHGGLGARELACDSWKTRESIVVINCQEVTKERMKEKKEITPHVLLFRVSCLHTKRNLFFQDTIIGLMSSGGYKVSTSQPTPISTMCLIHICETNLFFFQDAMIGFMNSGGYKLSAQVRSLPPKDTLVMWGRCFSCSFLFFF